jgi:hypothetical protein
MGASAVFLDRNGASNSYIYNLEFGAVDTKARAAGSRFRSVSQNESDGSIDQVC